MMHNTKAPYSPLYPCSRLFPGTYYMVKIDSKWNRHYARVPLDSEREGMGGRLAPPLVLRQIKEQSMSIPATGKLSVLAGEANAAKRIACVITGVAAGLPGVENVFGPDNMKMLCSGVNMIEAISGTGKSALLEKNVVQLKKNAGGKNERIPVKTEVSERTERKWVLSYCYTLLNKQYFTQFIWRLLRSAQSDGIKFAAQLRNFSLTEQYGVAKGLAETMDVAAQVAVAAGLEALKNAGLVSGKTNCAKDWILAEEDKDSTGVIYASSFPAMDAAVREVMRFLQSKTVGAATMERLVER